MKKMRRFAGLVLAMVMVMSMAVGVFAETVKECTITAPSNGHKYEVYQVFKGDYDTDSKKLSNIVWGANAKNNGTAVTEDESVPEEVLNVLSGISATETNRNKLAAILPYVDLEDDAFATLESGKSVKVSAGYYLIKDIELASTNDSYSTYLVEVVEDVTIIPKVGVPTVEKKVDDENDSVADDSATTDEVEGEDGSDWQDSADYDINDVVPFQLKATLAENVEDYAGAYRVVFHDTLSKGLTFKAITQVTIDGKPLETTQYAVSDRVLTNEEGYAGGTTFSVTIADAKALGATNESVIIVEYTATLNENAVIGADGNPNKVYLEFSNNPNWVPPTPSTPPGEEPPTPPTPPTGETPEDKVIVFTYKVVVNKVDQNNKPLAGAEFTLYKKNEAGVYEPIGTKVVGTIPENGTIANLFTWTGLDDGDYKLEETVTPAGYNTINPIEFKISATHDVDSEDPKLIELTGGKLFTGEVSTGTLTADVENKTGTVLPETGGMGTTLFYVIGATLAIGAAVVMVTRKRMSAN